VNTLIQHPISPRVNVYFENLWHADCEQSGMKYKWVGENMISVCSWCFPGETIRAKAARTGSGASCRLPGDLVASA
jgi:hypothetical protein